MKLIHLHLVAVVLALMAFAIDTHLGRSNWMVVDVILAGANLLMFSLHNDTQED